MLKTGKSKPTEKIDESDSKSNDKVEKEPKQDAFVEAMRKGEEAFDKQMDVLNLAYAKYKAKHGVDLVTVPTHLLTPELKADLEAFIKEAEKEIAEGKKAPVAKIEDFGEVIEGAKKHTFTRNESTAEDLASMPLSKAFPQPDYQKMVSEGVWTEDEALAMKYLYDNIPAKPRKPFAVRSWVAKAQSVIDVFNDMITDKRMSKKVLSVLSGSGRFTDYNGFVATMKALGFPASSPNLQGHKIKQFIGHSKFSIVNGGLILGDYNTMAEAVTALKGMLNAPTNKTKETKFTLYQDTTTKKYFIGKKGAVGTVRLIDNIETLKEAREIFNTQKEQLQKMWDALKVNTPERRDTNRKRIGIDYRNGKDVTPESFNVFGFRGVQFGNYVNAAERQQSLNEAYDALMDLAKVLGISPKAISLNGEMGIAFGARGNGGKGAASAHYEPGQIVINLTKNKGAGSLAHEWFHAVDNYFSRIRGYKSNYITEHPIAYNKPTVRPEVIEAFGEVMKAIKQTKLKDRSLLLDKTRSTPYWSTSVEMAARSFENYIIETLGATGEQNDYLANFKSTEEWLNDAGADMEKYPYPMLDEVEIINNAFRNLFDTIKESETGALYHIGKGEMIPVTEEAHTALVDQLKKTGLARDVQVLAGDEFLQAVGVDGAVLQSKMSSLSKAAKFIRDGLSNNVRGKSFTIELPTRVQKMIMQAMGRDFDSHNIEIGGINHALKEHGVNGNKITAVSIPITPENAELIPYIMVSPDRVANGSVDATGRESIRFYKNLSNGYVVVVEKEQKNSPDDMDTITMWAEKSSNAVDARLKTSPKHTSDNETISRDDIAKIMQDAEKAISDDVKYHAVYHGSPHSFDQFSLEHLGTGEGAQVYGYGLYFTDKKGIAEEYAKLARHYDKMASKEVEGKYDFKINGKLQSETKLGYDNLNLIRILSEEIQAQNLQGEEISKHIEEDIELQQKLLKETIDHLNDINDDKLRAHIAEKNRATVEKRIELLNKLLQAHKDGKLKLISPTVTVTPEYKHPRNLYSVKIHGDKTVDQLNFLRWDKPVTEEQQRVVLQIFDDFANMQTEYSEASKLANESIHYDFTNKTGQQIYNRITELAAANRSKLEGKYPDDVWGRADKLASLLLSEIGIDGIQYPTEYTSKGAHEEAFNYVVFDDKAVEITEHVKFLRTPSGTIYGAVKDGVVYLNKDVMNLNTPIHEFGHLFTPVLKAQHPEFFAKGVELIKESSYYEEVKNDPNYKHLDEEGIIDEAMNRAIGDNGAKVVGKTGLGAKLKAWIKGVWERIGAAFGIKNLTSEQIRNLNLKDWVDIVNSEMLSGEKVDRGNIPQEVLDKQTTILEPVTEFKNIAEAKAYAIENFQGKSFRNKDTGEKIFVSGKAINKTFNKKAVNQSANISIHISTMSVLDKILEESILVEAHDDRNDDPNIEEIQRFYGALKIGGELYRVKTTVKKVRGHSKKCVKVRKARTKL